MKRHTLGALAFSAFLSLDPAAAAAQELLKVDGSCVFVGTMSQAQTYGFVSDEAAQAAISQILRQTGLTQNFTLFAGNVDNAAAVISGERRLIIYNQQFIRGVASATKTAWSEKFILAHEIGHHLNGHTLSGEGSRPPIELEADRFAGFILARMGASLPEAQAAIRAIATETVSSTHPPQSARLAAISNGYFDAADLQNGSRIPQPGPFPLPGSTETTTGDVGLPFPGKFDEFRNRIYFSQPRFGEYFASQSGRIYNRFGGEVRQVGYISKSSFPGYNLDFNIFDERFVIGKLNMIYKTTNRTFVSSQSAGFLIAIAPNPEGVSEGYARK